MTDGPTEFRDKLILAQFETIRKEIEFTKDRLFKILSAGVVVILIVIPGMNALALKFEELDVLLLGVPFVIILYALFFVSETRALMRAGQYLRTVIEEEFFDFTGWESWLEDASASKRQRSYRRSHDILLFWGFVVFCSLSYCAAVWYAHIFFISKLESEILGSCIMAFYVGVGLISLFLAVFSAQTTTQSD